MADNYVDKLKIGGVDRPIQDTTSGFYAKPTTGIPSTDLSSDVQTSLGKADGAIPSTQKGANGGVATLGDDGKVPASQLPSYVDDVLEYDNRAAFPETGESGKIYVNKANNTTYRWSGTTYVQIKGDIVIGTTTGTAADGGTVNTHITDTDIHVTATDKTAWNGKYAKPSTGIPASDLADGVIPTSLPANGGNAATVNNHSVAADVPSDAVFTDTTYSVMGASGSTHAGGLVPDTPTTAGTSKFLCENGTWAEPTDTNTTYQLTVNGTAAGDTTSGTNLGSVYAPTSAGTEGQMLIANASGIPTWGSKPSYAYGEVGYEIATQTTSGAVTIDGTKPLHIITLSGAATSVAFSTGNLPAVGHSSHIIFTASSDTTVSIAHVSTGAVRYICPGGENPEDLEVPAGGYVEIDLLRGADTEESNDTVSWIYVRGV